MINVLRLYCGKVSRSDQIRYARHEGIGPVVAYNCTNRCNLWCVHCYSDAGQQGQELDTDQAKALLAQLVQARCPVVLFSGGEPLLRPDIMDLLAYARSVGLQAAISTNGTLIDRTSARELARVGVHYVGVSIDGPEHIHDLFRRRPGSFRGAVGGIESCKAAGIRVGIRYTISVHNIEHIPFVFGLAKDLEVRRLCFYHLVVCGRACREDIPTPAQTRLAMDTILDNALASADGLDEVLTVGNHADGPYLLLCMAREGHPNLKMAWACLKAAGGNRSGIGIACVGPDGNVFADQFWRNYSLGNVMERPFAQIWHDEGNHVLRLIRQKDMSADPRCLGCCWFEICKGNARFRGPDPALANWVNEPACYLSDQQIHQGQIPSPAWDASSE